MQAMDTETAGGLHICKHETGRVWDKNPKLSYHDLVTGMPCKTLVGSGGVRWWLWAKNTETAGEDCAFANTRAGGGAWDKTQK